MQRPLKIAQSDHTAHKTQISFSFSLSHSHTLSRSAPYKLCLSFTNSPGSNPIKIFVRSFYATLNFLSNLIGCSKFPTNENALKIRVAKKLCSKIFIGLCPDNAQAAPRIAFYSSLSLFLSYFNLDYLSIFAKGGNLSI